MGGLGGTFWATTTVAFAGGDWLYHDTVSALSADHARKIARANAHEWANRRTVPAVVKETSVVERV
jgi:hypothetical protein